MTPNQVEFLLRNLRLIEAVGRLGSFSAAAGQLGMTQPAVSQQVAQLEKILGVTLFVRRHRGVVPADAGRILCATAADILTRIGSAMDEVHVKASRRTLTVLTDYGFASNWLLPRLVEFEASCPELDIRILTIQSRSSGTMRREIDEADLSILFGAAPSADDVDTVCLFEEEVTPVCSPAFFEKNGPFEDVASVAHARLMHLSGPVRMWFTWADWFAMTGLTSTLRVSQKNVRLFDNYPLLLQAILRGEGIGLGWRPLIDEYLQNGQLVAVWSEPIQSRRGYFLSVHRSRNEACELFKAWVIDESRNATLFPAVMSR